MADRKTFTAPLSTADRYYIFHDYIKNGANYDSDKKAALQSLFIENTWTWNDDTQLKYSYTDDNGKSQEVLLTFNYDDNYPYGWKIDLDLSESTAGDDYSILATSDTADSITLTTGSGSSMLFTDSDKYDSLNSSLSTSINNEIDANTTAGQVATSVFDIFTSTDSDEAFIAAYNSYTEPVVVKYITDFLPIESQTNYVIPQGFTLADGTIFKKGETISYVYSMEEDE